MATRASSSPPPISAGTRRAVALATVIPLLVCLVFAQSAVEDERALAAVRQALAHGAYRDAVQQAQRLSAAVEAAAGPGSLAGARVSDLLVQALIRNGEAGAPSTLTLGERTVQTKTQLGADDLETAASLHNLAEIRVERGEFAVALPLAQRALDLRSRRLPADAEAIADSLDALAWTLMQLERHDEARKILVRAIAIRDAHAASQPLALARTLELRAWLDRYEAHYDDGRAVLARALALRQSLPPDHPDLVLATKLQGDLLWFGGNIEGARKTWADGLVRLERSLGSEHSATIAFRRRLAVAAVRIGDSSDARALRDRAFPLAEASLAPCSPDRLGLRADRADSLTYAGEYNEARRLYQAALTEYQKCVGPTSTRTATVVYNLGLLLVEMGDFAAAERLYEQTIRTWSARLGPTHPYLARPLDAQADVALARGEPDRAQRLYARALAIRRRQNPTHPDVAWSLTNLARVKTSTGQLTLALRDVSEAIAILRESGPADEPDHLARVLALRGAIESRLGHDREARASLVEALATRERVFGRSHPLAAESRAALAATDFALGAYDDALGEALDAERTGRDHLQFTVRYLPERQAMAYAAKRPRALDVALSMAAAGTAPSLTPILDAVIQSRGVILDELAARGRVAAEVSDAPVSARRAAAVEARQRFANLVVRSLEDAIPRAVLDRARDQKEEAERALAEEHAEGSAELARTHIGATDVHDALPADAALVSFVLYDRTLVAAAGAPRRSRTPVRSYGALIQRAGSPTVAFVPLGAATTVDAAIKAWRAEASGASPAGGPSTPEAARAYRRAATALRVAVWDPLTPHLAQVSRIFIVPDGLLNIVTFAALPDRAGRYLVEGDAVLHYLSTERDLVAPASDARGRGLLAVGGPAFGRTPGAPATGSARRSGCEDFGSVSFDPLPGSLREVAEIGKTWPIATPGDVTMLSGRAATETAVKQAFAGRRVVHLATHGFFLAGDCTTSTPGTRSIGGLTVGRKGSATLEDNPLLLAGLAFAGANERRAARVTQDDGILTAEEIGGLNLQGTEWAVLSACDTGLGEFKAGEGVFGLRRAFQIAGAHTVIMSLWSVEDQSTTSWMRALYEGRLRRGLSTADAVREASLTVLRERRSRGRSTHPFFWAGFVAAGDWR